MNRRLFLQGLAVFMGAAGFRLPLTHASEALQPLILNGGEHTWVKATWSDGVKRLFEGSAAINGGPPDVWTERDAGQNFVINKDGFFAISDGVTPIVSKTAPSENEHTGDLELITSITKGNDGDMFSGSIVSSAEVRRDGVPEFIYNPSQY